MEGPQRTHYLTSTTYAALPQPLKPLLRTGFSPLNLRGLQSENQPRYTFAQVA